MLIAGQAWAGPPYLVDPETGKFLGNLSANRFDPNSVNNPFGRYGSQFSPDSINNPFGRYGSRFSRHSIANPYASSPPVVMHDEMGPERSFVISR